MTTQNLEVSVPCTFIPAPSRDWLEGYTEGMAYILDILTHVAKYDPALIDVSLLESLRPNNWNKEPNQ